MATLKALITGCSSQQLLQHSTLERVLTYPPRSLTFLVHALRSNTTQGTAIAIEEAFYSRAFSVGNLRSTPWHLECYKAVCDDIRAKQLMPASPSILDTRMKSLQAKFDRAAAVQPNAGLARASKQEILGMFESYCAINPKSFLALVCKPAMARALKDTADLEPIRALSQTLLDYLGVGVESGLRLNGVNAFFQELDTFYQSELHWFYSIFFEALTNQAALCHETKIDVTVSLTQQTLFQVEDIALVIQKLQKQENLQALQAIESFSIQLVDVGQDCNTLGLIARIPPQLTYLSGLRTLTLKNLGLYQVDISKLPSLVTLDVSYNRVSEINLGCSSSLTYVDVQYNQLATIDTSELPNLQQLCMQNNQITSLDTRANAGLEELDVRNNPLTALDLTQNPKITYCYHNHEVVITLADNS